MNRKILYLVACTVYCNSLAMDKAQIVQPQIKIKHTPTSVSWETPPNPNANSVVILKKLLEEDKYNEFKAQSTCLKNLEFYDLEHLEAPLQVKSTFLETLKKISVSLEMWQMFKDLMTEVKTETEIEHPAKKQKVNEDPADDKWIHRGPSLPWTYYAPQYIAQELAKLHDQPNSIRYKALGIMQESKSKWTFSEFAKIMEEAEKSALQQQVSALPIQKDQNQQHNTIAGISTYIQQREVDILATKQLIGTFLSQYIKIPLSDSKRFGYRIEKKDDTNA